MIFEPQNYLYIFQDAIYALPVGFLAGFINRLLSAFTGRNKKIVFIKDLIMTTIFTVLVFSYSVSFTNYRVLRWYMALSALVGFVMFPPFVEFVLRVCMSCTILACKRMLSCIVSLAGNCFNKVKQGKIKKHQKITQKTEQQVLKEEAVVLYN